MRYRVHQFNLGMTRDLRDLEDFLNELEGEVVAILPNVLGLPVAHGDMLLVVERTGEEWRPRHDRGKKLPEDIVVP